jgi:hypothetical protein
MPLQSTSGAASYDAFGGGVAVIPNYIEEVFSTYLYTGNGGTKTITNGIDLAGEGGLVWIKDRSAVSQHEIFDTVRGLTQAIHSETTAQQFATGDITSANSNGWTMSNANARINANTITYVSWTFRKQPKFCDVQTFTTTGTGGTQILSHDLGAVPAFILLKKTSGTGNWWAIHRSVTQYSPNWWQNTGVLEGTGAFFQGDLLTSEPTATQIALGPTFTNSGNEGTYVAYIFAHNAGGFGLTGLDNVISCGSFTTDGSGVASVSLGYEPQWVMTKNSSGSSAWRMFDTMRGMTVAGQNDALLQAQSSSAEIINSDYCSPNATGFAIDGHSGSATHIYIAIRRGPMKVPTSGTEVFDVGTRSGSGSVAKTNSDILTDLTFIKNRTSGGEYWAWTPRLNGDLTLQSNSTDANLTGAMATNPWDTMTGAFCAASNGATNSGSLIDYSFRRAPGFFDVVCYTGTAPTAQNLTHNLGVAPEFIIIKRRDASGSWFTGSMFTSTTVTRAVLNANNDQDLNSLYSGQSIFGGQPTASVFSVGTGSGANASGGTFVAYLFATLAGVSKVGSYTGTGTTLQINCGFTGGARFVMIKRTDSTGDWYVWDSARGIIAGNDPYLLFNSTAAEVTNTDYVDTYSAGFEISSTAPAAINANGGSFIFLAIA